MKTVKHSLRWLLAIFFIFAGVMHFVRPGFFVRAVPPYFAWPLELVHATGVLEIVLGGLLLLPGAASQSAAAWGMVITLVLFSIVHLHMAIVPEQFPGIPRWLIYLRLPLQLLLIAWAWWYTQPAAPRHSGLGPIANAREGDNLTV